MFTSEPPSKCPRCRGDRHPDSRQIKNAPCCCVNITKTNTGGLVRGDAPKPSTHTASSQPDLAQHLRQVGVSAETVRSLLREYPAARIARQLSWLSHRNAKNPAGLLVQAIRGDWSPPPIATGAQHTPVQIPSSPTCEAKATDETHAKLKQAKAEQAREKQRQARLKALERRLPPSKRDALRKQAEATVRRRLKAAWPKRRPIPKTFLDAEYYHLIEQRFGRQQKDGTGKSKASAK